MSVHSRKSLTSILGFGLVVGLVIVAPAQGVPAAAAPTVVPGQVASSVAGEGKQPTSRLSPRLALLAQPEARATTPRLLAQALSLPAEGAGSVVRPAADTVLVEIRAAGSTAAVSAVVNATGGQVTHVSDRYATVTAVVPVASLTHLGSVAAVAYVGEVLQPDTGASAATGSAAPTGALPSVVTPAPCGSTTSEGDSQLKAATARTAFGVDGTGVTVGVLSDSYDNATNAQVTNAAADIAAGNLPGPGNPCGRTTPVSVLADNAPRTSPNYTGDEGRAMIQIVHDVAPGAHLSFATAFTGLTAFADNIRSLRTAGADVIVDDVFYLAEPFYQPGPISVAIDDVTAAGARYVTLAGNHNRIAGGKDVGTWEAPAYRATTCPAAVLSKYGTGPVPTDCLDVDPGAGVDPGRGFTLAAGADVRLSAQWAEPWYGVATDLDLFLVDTATATVVATSWYTNPGTNGSQVPFEILGFRNTTGAARSYDIVVARYWGSGAPRVKTMFMQGTSALANVEYPVSAGGDVVGPSVYGHSGATNATVVGAVPYNDATTPETYTSRGPMTTYFGPVLTTTPASATAPVVLAKPDVAATDGGANPFFGSFENGAYRFYGTSAAAPHAAAVGALVLQKQPSLGGAQLRSVLEDTATAMPAAPLNSVGTGLVNALAAVSAVSPPTAAPVITAATPGRGQVTLSFTGVLTGPAATGYGASCLSSDGGTARTAAGTSPMIVAGLTSLKAYQCRVRATNANGPGPWSTAAAVTMPDSSAPRVTLGSLPAAVLAMPRITWSASDDGVLTGFRLRLRTAPNGGRLGPWSAPRLLPGTSRAYLPAAQRPGGVCFEITALDRGGNASIPAVRCSAIALDDRSLTASRGGWSKTVSSSAYLRTLSTSTRKGASLVKARSYGSGLTLLVTKGPRAGTLGVYVNGRLKATVALNARRAAVRQLVPVRTGPMSGATVVIKVLVAGRGVGIDGLAVSP